MKKFATRNKGSLDIITLLNISILYAAYYFSLWDDLSHLYIFITS